MPDPEIICERQGAVGLVTLNRPDSMNALTHGMVDALARALDAWEVDPSVRCVLVTAAGGRAFSAGGDLRMLHEAGTSGRHEDALAFWRDEYRLNIRIKRYPKPYVSLVDGIVMGGGVGISLHGSHRVAGERYSFAMPEVSIGFFPDVGATYALSRLPGQAGTYVALTGERVRRDDAVRLGLATHLVASVDLPDLRDRLIDGAGVDVVLRARAQPPGEGPITAAREVIDHCFAADRVTDILDRLDEAARQGSDFAAQTAATMRSKSPGSLAIALEQMRRGVTLDFAEAMATEFRIVSRVAREPDFYEGVRATIIDKDGRPRWMHEGAGSADPAWVEAHFRPLGDSELETD